MAFIKNLSRADFAVLLTLMGKDAAEVSKEEARASWNEMVNGARAVCSACYARPLPLKPRFPTDMNDALTCQSCAHDLTIKLPPAPSQ
jgi:hypothetical protein